MTGTWETWLSMCCRPGTWPRGTTTVTRTLLSRFTCYLGEGELPVFCESSRISVLCLPFCFCVCLVVSPLFSFWPCIHCTVLELTNWFRLYERMRMDTMTWGSHPSLPLIQWVFHKEEPESQAFKGPPFIQTRCIRLLCASACFGLAPLCGGTGLLFLSRSTVSTQVWKGKGRIDTHLAAL